jgi:hypothetical protein
LARVHARHRSQAAFLAFSLADAVSFSLSGLEAIVVRYTAVVGSDRDGTRLASSHVRLPRRG